jgi:2,4-dienoyl-CoA reductase-like NADH-dependent reductase (Old Yellow Enzyme family)
MRKQLNGGRITMTKLFELTLINGMSLSNRFVRSATWEGLADKDGSVTPKLIEVMVELVKGEVGLIISSYAFVSPAGKSGPGQLAVYDDRFLPGLKEMVKAVHSAGGKIALQIVHGGIFANSKLTGLELIGPSAGEKDSQPTCRPMTKENITEIISAFTRAALRAKQAGFDAIQIHAAHGFLLSEFLSPAFNRRADEYGGTLENRARLLLEAVRSIRKAIGTDHPILVKLNAEDFLENGMTREESVQVSRMLEEASVDSIEFSGGTVASPKTLIPPRPGMLKAPENEVYYRETARLYKQKVNIPLMLVGGIRSYRVADELIESGTADYIALARPLICEPGLVKRWREGDLRKAECASDNECFGPAMDGRGVYCVTMEKKRSKSVK